MVKSVASVSGVGLWQIVPGSPLIFFTSIGLKSRWIWRLEESSRSVRSFCRVPCGIERPAAPL